MLLLKPITQSEVKWKILLSDCFLRHLTSVKNEGRFVSASGSVAHQPRNFKQRPHQGAANNANTLLVENLIGREFQPGVLSS